MAETALQEAVSHLALRALEPLDVPFVFSSWLKSYRKAQERALARIDRNAHFDVRAFYESQDCAINRLLRRCTAVVMCSPHRPADIYAYAVFSRGEGTTVLHWVYSKHVFRRMGLAAHLLDRIGGDRWMHSHQTAAFNALAARLGSVHNPSLSR